MEVLRELFDQDEEKQAEEVYGGRFQLPLAGLPAEVAAEVVDEVKRDENQKPWEDNEEEDDAVHPNPKRNSPKKYWYL